MKTSDMCCPIYAKDINLIAALWTNWMVNISSILQLLVVIWSTWETSWYFVYIAIKSNEWLCYAIKSFILLNYFSFLLVLTNVWGMHSLLLFNESSKCPWSKKTNILWYCLPHAHACSQM